MLIVFNPTAGRRRAHLLWRVLDVLAGSGVRFEVAETRHAGHAVELSRGAEAGGHKLCVAAGGDGTVAEVASGLDGQSTVLGIIPLGTANVLAQELGLSLAPQAVAAALALGRTRALWPGVAHGPAGPRLFVQMLGAGFDAQVVHRLPLALKRVVGRSAYVMQTLRELQRYDFAPVHIRVDGVEQDAASVIVSKGRLYGGNYLLAPGAASDLPGFSVALFDRRGVWPALVYGAGAPAEPAAPRAGLPADPCGTDRDPQQQPGAGGRRPRRHHPHAHPGRAPSDPGGDRIGATLPDRLVTSRVLLRYDDGFSEVPSCSANKPPARPTGPARSRWRPASR